MKMFKLPLRTKQGIWKRDEGTIYKRVSAMYRADGLTWHDVLHEG